MTRERAAAGLFAAVVAVAVPLYLWRGGKQWFYLDEWDFLATRHGTDLLDLFRPHNEHWTTLPILAYRVLWRLVGLHSYRPYQLLAIGLHLAAAVLLRALMRRAQVDAWIATVTASAFVLFGAGHENITWAFQIGFSGSLVFGFSALLVADHDGPMGRSDACALLLGLASLMSSGFGVTMGLVVCLAVFARRGWRAGALYSATLGGSFLAWWLAFGRGAYGSPSLSPRGIVEFEVVGLTNLFARLGQLPGVGIALAVLLVGGLVLAWAPLPRAQLRRQAAAPGALLVGCLAFLLITAVGRLGTAAIAIRLGVINYATDGARAGRYVHLLAALTLPALAIAADAVIRRWRVAIPVVLLLLLAGIPGNVRAIDPTGPDRFRLGQPDLVLALAQSPFARLVPRNTRPLGFGGPDVTTGWLLDGVASGRIPRPHLDPSQVATASIRLVLRQRSSAAPLVGCAVLDAPVERRMRRGESFRFGQAALTVQLRLQGALSDAVVFQPTAGQRIAAIAGPIDLRISPALGGPSPNLCA